jgi:hypothetical protein
LTNWLALIVSLVGGGVGGNISGALMQKFNLSPVGNTIAGIEGGGVGAQLLSMSGGAAAAAAAPASGMDLSSILSSVGCRTDFQFGNSYPGGPGPGPGPGGNTITPAGGTPAPVALPRISRETAHAFSGKRTTRLTTSAWTAPALAFFQWIQRSISSIRIHGGAQVHRLR